MVAMLFCGLVLDGSDAYAAKPKSLRLKRSQEDARPAPTARPLTPSPSTPATSKPLEAEALFQKGMSLVRVGSLESAISTLNEAVNLGSGEALIVLGKIYAHGGDRIPRNDSLAEQYLRRAVVMDFPHAYAALAVFYHQRDTMVGSKEKAGNLLYKGISRGHTKPFKNANGDTLSLFYFLANFAYLDTQSGQARFSKAAKWASQGAEVGDPASMVLLSQLYDAGNGVEKSPETALLWAQRASDLGSQSGSLRLAHLKKKQAVPVREKPLPLTALSAKTLNEQAEAAYKAEDFVKAVQLYREASKRNEPAAASAIFQLAWAYVQAKGVSQDFSEAEKLFKQYIAAGQDGYGSLAYVYQRMHPGIVGNQMAQDTLLEGVARGHTDLYANLGELSANLVKYEEAKNWYWKGIAAKDGGSMAGLSKLYRDGYGVPKNPARALYWARRAEQVGEYYGTLLIKDFTQEGVTVEDAPSEAELAAETAKAADVVADALSKVPQPAPVQPPTFTEATPPVVKKPSPVPGEAQQSLTPSSPLSNVFDLLNRLPPPPPLPPPEIAQTVEPEVPPASIATESTKPVPTAGEIQAAEAKTLLETGFKAYQNGHYTRAFRMFREAAQKGNAQAQYETAEMLIEGQGVEKDRALGKQWLMISAMQGNTDARQLQARVEAEDVGKPKQAATPKPPEPVAPVASVTPAIAKPVEPPPPPVETKPVPIPITEKRVALVIGNAAYPGGAALSNPRNDAQDLGSALRKVGFDVVSGTDLTQRAFADTMAQFTSKAEGADVALVYYAGHAMQLDGENWLLPVDVRSDSALNVRLTSLPLQTVVGEVENRVKTTLVFLDACRNNPIEEALKARLRQSKRGFSETRGLARVTVTSPDTLVVFATQPNATAEDGKGRNSPFTEAILENIATPGVEIETLMKRVSAAVGEKTRQKQEPERLSRLKSEFYFVPVQ
jgi:TPR repeat protein